MLLKLCKQLNFQKSQSTKKEKKKISIVRVQKPFLKKVNRGKSGKGKADKGKRSQMYGDRKRFDFG